METKIYVIRNVKKNEYFTFDNEKSFLEFKKGITSLNMQHNYEYAEYIINRMIPVE